jgi:dTDP-4-dehydrorhamnose 3,5-epimerase
MAGERTAKAGRRIAQAGELVLMLPDCQKGLGQIINSPTSADLIEGVRIEPLTVYPDDRGYFVELQRIGKGLASQFPAATTQVSAAMNHPGAIKAFHYHLHQTDCWNPVRGLLQVALADLRTGSPTFGRRNTMYIGPLRPWQLLVPPGVAHGYKVIGTEDALLVYLTDRFYNPQDEGRIPYDDASINYDWETQRK